MPEHFKVAADRRDDAGRIIRTDEYDITVFWPAPFIAIGVPNTDHAEYPYPPFVYHAETHDDALSHAAPLDPTHAYDWFIYRREAEAYQIVDPGAS